jgi:hypothetical protein
MKYDSEETMMLFFEPTQKIGFLVQNNNIPDT